MQIAASLFQRNNSRHLLEWFAWYHTLGVDTFLVYDHMSDDNSYDIIKKLSNFYDVRHRQIAGYSAGIECWDYTFEYRATGEFDWIIVADADEFYYPTDDDNLKDVLSRYLDKKLSCLGIYWVMYGNNDHIDWEPGLVVECFTKRNELNHALNHHIKPILRGGSAGGNIWKRNDGHCLITEYGTYDVLNRLVSKGFNYPAENLHEILRINHYWAKSLEFFRTVKQPNGQRSDRPESDPGTNITEEFWWKQNFNDVTDTSAWDRFGASLKENYEIMRAQIGV